MPTSIETLHELVRRGFVLGMVSNGYSSEQLEKCDKLGIRNLFKCITVSETAGVVKPDAAIFDMTLQAMGVSAAEAMMVGDSPEADIQGAINAGILPVFFGPEPWDCESDMQAAGARVIRKISDVLEMPELAGHPSPPEQSTDCVVEQEETKSESVSYELLLAGTQFP